MLPVLAREFKPSPAENRMRNAWDVLAARADYAQRKSANLHALLRSRFEWMNHYIRPDFIGVDVGCGAGFSREFIRCKKLLLTDLTDHDYLDIPRVDALHLPFCDSSLDFVIQSNVLHHLSYPVRALNETRRVLRPGGFLLMHEVQASVLFCAVLRAMRHEGYSFDANVFDENTPCSNLDPWTGNNAIPRLLFDKRADFLNLQPGWRILRDSPCECLMFLNSGGVTAKTAYIPLPALVLSGVERLDNFLARLAPRLLALGRRIALQKIEPQ